MIVILIVSANLASSSLLKINAFWNKGYGVIISTYDVTKKNLSRNSYYIVDVVIWPKFDNSSISMRDVIARIWPEKTIFWGAVFVQVKYLESDTKLKLYSSVAKGPKVKAGKFLELVPTFCTLQGENWYGAFLTLSATILNSVKTIDRKFACVLISQFMYLIEETLLTARNWLIRS